MCVCGCCLLVQLQVRLFTCSASSYGAGVMQGLHPNCDANATINSSSLTNIWKVWSPMVTASTVLPTGRACVLSSVSTVASWILIMCCLVCVVVLCVCIVPSLDQLVKLSRSGSTEQVRPSAHPSECRQRICWRLSRSMSPTNRQQRGFPWVACRPR